MDGDLELTVRGSQDQPQESKIQDETEGEPLLESAVQADCADTCMKTTRTETNELSEVLLLLLLIPSFLSNVAGKMMVPVLPWFAKNQLHASTTEIGSLAAAKAFGKLICNVPLGWMVSLFYENNSNSNLDGRSLLPIVLACLILASAYAVAGFTTTATGFLAFRLWEGAGWSLWVLGRQTLLNELTTKENRGRYMATLGGVGRIASVFGPYLGGFVATKSKAQWSFWCQAVLMVFNAAVVLGIKLWVNQNVTHQHPNGYTAAETSEVEANESQCKSIQEDGRNHDGDNDAFATANGKPNDPSSNMSWLELLRRHGWILMALAVFGFFASIVREARHLLFPLQAMEIGYDAHTIGIMTSITFLVDSAMFPVAGYLADCHGRKYSGIPALVIMGLSSASVPALTKIYPTSITALTLASAGFGLGNGLSSGLLMSMAGDASPSRGQDRAKFLALFRTCTDAGLLLGPWVSGILADHFSVSVGFQVVAGVAAAGALWMALVIPETARPSADGHGS
ncbi:Major facilitator superfamily [Seminavis robusta]|uniref:Major facilitator superfamily n=1 Tax=Seminavis robusta TaxID=568900 RepID=A0A9N8DRF7_9STRA|nr:Major facilitator superfamily [Seminavis robusta]|eukprot:Sro228_g092580.1 Major facilitator superfamily (512) ;mRNA; f:21397-22932